MQSIKGFFQSEVFRDMREPTIARLVAVLVGISHQGAVRGHPYATCPAR